jgi:hypothetical protein
MFEQQERRKKMFEQQEKRKKIFATESGNILLTRRLAAILGRGSRLRKAMGADKMLFLGGDLIFRCPQVSHRFWPITV